jgi:hypothetical protein
LVDERAGVRLAAVTENEPRLNVSRPTPLRAGGFLLIAVGAVLMGVGAIATWITVGIPNESDHSSFRGTELPDGRVVLACALMVLIAIVTSRLVRSRRVRYGLALVTGVAGLLSAVLAFSFIRSGRDRAQVLDALGIPRELWDRFGVFRDLGVGVYFALVGGILCLAGAILTLRWVQRLPRDTSPTREVSAEQASG